MKKNKKLKKIVTTLLSLVLAGILTVPAFADPNGSNRSVSSEDAVNQEDICNEQDHAQSNTTEPLSGSGMQEFDMDDFENIEDFRQTLLSMIEEEPEDEYGIATLNTYGNSLLTWAECDEQYLSILDEVREKMKDRESEIVVTYHTEEEIDQESLGRHLALAILYDALIHTGDPEGGDYLFNNFSKSGHEGELIKCEDGGTDIKVTLTFTWRTSYEDEQKITKEINRIFDSFNWNKDTTDYEKIYDIYHYITNTVKYDYDHLALENAGTKYPAMRTAYGALVDHTAICQGVAVTIYRMMLEAGIDCRYVTGDVTGGSHAWDIVKLDGQWYNVDATWDLGYAYYVYFLLGSETFEKTHVRNGGYSTDEFNALYPISETDYPVPIPAIKKDSDGKWYYYNENGEKDLSYTGFAANNNGKWYVEKGVVTFTKNSVVKDTTGAIGGKGTWYYVVGSKVKTGYTGLANYKNENGWWYIKNGEVDFTRNSVDKNCNGWWYVTGGKVQFNFTGLANYKNSNGWWYISGGKVDFSRNSVDKNKNGWWLVEGGKVNFNYTGVANYKNVNGWWYIKNGKVDFSYTGKASNKNGIWNVVNGKVKF